MPVTVWMLISEVGAHDRREGSDRVLPAQLKLRWIDALNAASSTR